MSDYNNYYPEGVQSEFDRHEGDTEWENDGEELYEEMLDQMIEDFGSDVMDQHAADLMWNAWFSGEVDRFERAEFLFDFFDYTGLSYEDFDWDTWRDWYES